MYSRPFQSTVITGQPALEAAFKSVCGTPAGLLSRPLLALLAEAWVVTLHHGDVRQGRQAAEWLAGRALARDASLQCRA